MAALEAADPVGQSTNAIARLLATDILEALLAVVLKLLDRGLTTGPKMPLACRRGQRALTGPCS